MVTINEVGRRRRVLLPDDCIQVQQGVRFIRIGTSSKSPYSRSLFANNVRGHHLLKYTNIFEQLRDLRHECSSLPEPGETNASGADEGVHFELFEPSSEMPIQKSKRKRYSATERANLFKKTIITVDAPTIGDVEGIPMNILFDRRVNNPLWVELTARNITYLRRVCAHQIEQGVTVREKPEKKARIVVKGKPGRPKKMTNILESESDQSNVSSKDHESGRDSDGESDELECSDAVENIIVPTPLVNSDLAQVVDQEGAPSHEQLLLSCRAKRQVTLQALFKA